MGKLQTWWADPLSKELIKAIEDEIASLDKAGSTVAMCSHTVNNSIRVGKAMGLRWILDIKETELEEEKEREDEQTEDSTS